MLEHILLILSILNTIALYAIVYHLARPTVLTEKIEHAKETAKDVREKRDTKRAHQKAQLISPTTRARDDLSNL